MCCNFLLLLHFHQMLVKVQKGLRSGDESVEIIKQTVEIDSVLSTLPLPGDVVKLVEGGDIVDVVHPLDALEVDELVVALVEVEELAVTLLVTELNHVVGLVSTRLSDL